MDSTGSNGPSKPNPPRKFLAGARPENVPLVKWRLFVASVAEARLSRNGNSINLHANETIFGANGECISFNDMAIMFSGNTNTYLYMIIRLPTGALRVVWDGRDLILDEKYRIAPDEFTIWSRNHRVAERPVPYFIELFGQRSDRLLLTTAHRDYMVRCERDYPAVVLPMDEYRMTQLTMLRDFSEDHIITAAPRRRRVAGRNRRGSMESHLSPRTPPFPDCNSSCVIVDDDDDRTDNSN